MNSPTPEQIVVARRDAGLTQTEAAALIHCSMRGWQDWERGRRVMHPTFWWAWRVKRALLLGATPKEILSIDAE